MGTSVHKVLEVLANCKKHMQQTSDTTWTLDDVELGKIEWTTEDFLKPYSLSNEEVDTINKTRINKSTYKHECKLKYGHIRYGISLVEKLIKLSQDYYAKSWMPVDYKDTTNWTWMALDHNNGLFDPRRREIIAAEPHFDFIIDKEWTRYDYVLPNGEKSSGNLGIKGTVDLITTLPGGIIYEVVDWKGLPIETPIPTLDGWKTMGSLEIGDIVFDENGNQTKVIGKSKKKIKPCYQIEFDDTSKVICDDEHLWKLADGSIVNTLNLKPKNYINITKPLNIEAKILPIDPYVLGIWLGDGRNRTGEVCGADRFIFDEIIRRGYPIGKNMDERTTHCPTHTILGLRTPLRLLNLLHNKHIPPIYLRASFNQRLDLLRGLLDSDGNVNTVRRQAVFTNCNKRLSDDVKELLLTLGQRPYQADVNGYGFGLHVKVYPIAFKPIDINPFLLPRKANKVVPDWGHGQSDRRQIRQIELVDNMETQCIMVDSPTNTYLCTKNMVPTHNTGQRLDWASQQDNKVKTYADLQQDFQLMLYYYAARRMYPEAKQIIVTIFFIRDGGPFTMCYDNQTLEEVEDRLRSRFNEIRACTNPSMQDPSQSNFKCKYICDYYKMTSPDKEKNFCRFIHKKINEVGIEKVTNDYTSERFSIGYYEAPGEI
jgi:hypothetical protein